MTRIQFRSSICDGYAVLRDDLDSRTGAVARSLSRRMRAHSCSLSYIGRGGDTLHYRATISGRNGEIISETTVFLEA